MSISVMQSFAVVTYCCPRRRLRSLLCLRPPVFSGRPLFSGVKNKASILQILSRVAYVSSNSSSNMRSAVPQW